MNNPFKSKEEEWEEEEEPIAEKFMVVSIKSNHGKALETQHKCIFKEYIYHMFCSNYILFKLFMKYLEEKKH